MIGIKKIHLYIIKSFLGVFLITFFGSLFILVLQFFLQYINDLVGKGVGLGVFIELFFYAGLTLIPLALPLAILIGSLMTFGNLGERLELLAMKAAGISLWKIMQPLIILVAIISLSGFYFSNNILPKTQVKMWTLVFSIREKSPELDIPEGVFYTEIPGRNIFIGQKVRNNDTFKDVIIYDFSRGFSNTSIVVADSGKMNFSVDKTSLLIVLYKGETFETLPNNTASANSITPYRREKFEQKDIVLDFDANFNLLGSELFDKQYVSKNAAQLQESMDSISLKMENEQNNYRAEFLRNKYFNSYTGSSSAFAIMDSSVSVANYNYDDVFESINKETQELIVSSAISRASTLKNDLVYNQSTLNALVSENRKHAIEWYKKFTLSFACLIFFFIGAPLGAIIRKGGMGLPIVLSTVLFISYYIFDNTGYKMAREGIWEVAVGMWFSSMVLLPLGMFLTYKAVTDTVIISIDSIVLHPKKWFSSIARKLQKTKNN
ncbi:MAG: LptF/LptG family permease [Paludibacteraceae bacterium]|nr:LptF/LptG family permease [Paludibacteraceae bacterium]MBP6284697.1 LptF/LptG family permease [Paludibacteraceae bacterium]